MKITTIALTLAAAAATPACYSTVGGDDPGDALPVADAATTPPPQLVPVADGGSLPDIYAAPIPAIDGAISVDAATSCPAGGTAGTAYAVTQNGELFELEPSTLATRSLGELACADSTGPYTLAVSAAGVAYVLYNDEALFAVDLGTLACTRTPYVGRQLGFTGQEGIAIGPAQDGSERLYMYGLTASGPQLASSDLTSFVMTAIGSVSPTPTARLPDTKIDAFGRMFGLGLDGTLIDVDIHSAALLGEDHTGFQTSQGFSGSAWALLAWNGQIVFIGGPQGNVARYDLVTKWLTPIGALNETIVGAAAAPCLR